MSLKFKTLVLVCFCFVSLPSLVPAGSLEKAILLNEHGLTTDAKRELIDVIFEKESKAADKAQAYYLLGNIAFGEDKIKVALSSWEQLIEKYPNSEEAGLVRDRITELSEIVIGSAKESIDNAVARSYLRHADFWFKSKSEIFKIDTSWIPVAEAAIKWYDKVITEFPKSEASRIAYEGKLKTLAQANFNKYIPILLQTFEEFEKDHPDAPTLQAFRYQIAQVYWKQDDYNPGSGNLVLRYPEEVQKWLNKIIDNAGSNDSFYRDLAKRRLENLSESRKRSGSK